MSVSRGCEMLSGSRLDGGWEDSGTAFIIERSESLPFSLLISSLIKLSKPDQHVRQRVSSTMCLECH